MPPFLCTKTPSGPRLRPINTKRFSYAQKVPRDGQPSMQPLCPLTVHKKSAPWPALDERHRSTPDMRSDSIRETSRLLRTKTPSGPRVRPLNTKRFAYAQKSRATGNRPCSPCSRSLCTKSPPMPSRPSLSIRNASPEHKIFHSFRAPRIALNQQSTLSNPQCPRPPTSAAPASRLAP